MTGRFVLGLAAIAVVTTSADARPRKRSKQRASMKHISRPDAPEATPAYRYGQLPHAECLAELERREIAFQAEDAPGVDAPVRLTAPLHGVTFRTNLREARRATTPWEIADCRLVLALDDFAEILARHDVVEVIHYSIYRAPRTSWPEGKIARQHHGAVAIDAAQFITADRRRLDVLDHFSGRIGARTCGKGARPRKKTPQAVALRAILCDAVDAHLFNIVLTPNHNRAHRNHFHLEVTGANWFLVD